jgi:antagonist of KipI
VVNAALEVLDPGILSTVQDFGRRGYERLGVPHSGACDRWGIAVANVLLGNIPSAAALEMTLIGPTLRARGPCVVGLGGADLGAVVLRTGDRVAPGTTHNLRDGDVLQFPGDSGGMRAYLSLRGGLDVPLSLGSRSTYLPAHLGGIKGRQIETGDVIRGISTAHEEMGARGWPERPSLVSDREPELRVVEGPDASLLPAVLDTLLRARWVIGPSSDRTGVRLVAGDGQAMPVHPPLVSRPVVWGAIQVPPSGEPIILQADHQTVGGYPVPAVVITADLPILAQLRPGGSVGFTLVRQVDALAALRDRAETFRRATERLRRDGLWQDLWLNTAG